MPLSQVKTLRLGAIELLLERCLMAGVSWLVARGWREPSSSSALIAEPSLFPGHREAILSSAQPTGSFL